MSENEFVKEILCLNTNGQLINSSFEIIQKLSENNFFSTKELNLVWDKLESHSEKTANEVLLLLKQICRFFSKEQIIFIKEKLVERQKNTSEEEFEVFINFI